MKRSERHRLKENDLSHALSEAAGRLAQQQRMFALVAGIVVVAALVAGGYWAWHTRTETRGQVMLGEALAVMQSAVEPVKPDANGKITQAPGTYPTVDARAQAGLQKFV